MNNYCVYRHVTPSGKVYIGITKQVPEKRWKNGHGYELCTAFACAIKKYGWGNIEHYIVCDGLTEDQACLMEQELIAAYHSDNPQYGYNLTGGGEHYVPNEEWRKRASASHIAYYHDHPKAKIEISERQRGKKATAETRKKQSESRKRYLEANPIARAKCGDSFRGKKRGEEFAQKLRAANYKKVRCVDTGRVFNSIQDAASTYSIARTSISNALTGRSKTAAGHKFEYYNVGDESDEQGNQSV